MATTQGPLALVNPVLVAVLSLLNKHQNNNKSLPPQWFACVLDLISAKTMTVRNNKEQIARQNKAL